MAYESVFDEATRKLQSEWAVFQYMQDPVKWDALVSQIIKLKPAGVHAMQRDGRLDIASYQIYDNPQLDWVLMVYNGIKHVGSDAPTKNTKAINLTLDGGESNLFNVPMLPADMIFVWNGISQPILSNQTGYYVVLNGGSDPEIYIIFNSNGTITISNVSATRYTFSISYVERISDDYLMTGQQILFPDYQATLKLIQQINSESERSVSGFARL
jgi:hypothetical protein